MAGDTIWNRLASCVQQLDEPFRASEIIGWFRRHHPDVNESSLRAHIQAATANSASRSGPFANRTPLITRIDHGVYIRYRSGSDPERSPRHAAGPGDSASKSLKPAVANGTRSSQPDLLLVSCVKSKAATPRAAKDLYTSSLFLKQREYAQQLGVPWFILSAEHALVAPDEWLSPYERYLPDTPASYRTTWGAWVVERLALLEGDLAGKTIEIHASRDYVDAVAGHLRQRRAVVLDPLAGLSLGERLQWYGDVLGGAAAEQPAPTSKEPAEDVDQLVVALTDRSAALSPSAFLARDRSSLLSPGLYSWWVDESGSRDLTRGLGHDVQPGLIYAGLAGATRWPSGKRSTNTLWERIGGMHLGSRHEFSTFRLTLGSVLAQASSRALIDEEALTRWMHEHLEVIARPYPDADSLGRVEEDLLQRLDPPLNLRGMAPTPIRSTLQQLRSRYGNRSKNRLPQEDQVDHSTMEKQFHRRMVELYERAKREANYPANYFLRMLSEHGGVETARRLVANDTPSDGFTQLYLKRRLDLTVEAAVLEPRFTGLFDEGLLDQARERLQQYGYE